MMGRMFNVAKVQYYSSVRTRTSVTMMRSTKRERLPGAPGIQINVPATYPSALPRHTELGVPPWGGQMHRH